MIYDKSEDTSKGKCQKTQAYQRTENNQNDIPNDFQIGTSVSRNNIPQMQVSFTRIIP